MIRDQIKNAVSQIREGLDAMGLKGPRMVLAYTALSDLEAHAYLGIRCAYGAAGECGQLADVTAHWKDGTPQDVCTYCHHEGQKAGDFKS